MPVHRAVDIQHIVDRKYRGLAFLKPDQRPRHGTVDRDRMTGAAACGKAAVGNMQIDLCTGKLVHTLADSGSHLAHRYCIDILHQVQAVKSALAKVESQILKDHAACCVSEAIATGSPAEQKEKFDELIDLFEKVKR